MSQRKKPVFGIISVILMLGLAFTAILIAYYLPSPPPAMEGESLAVAMGAAANIIATLLILGAVSVSAIILAVIGLLRREPPLFAAIGLCMAVPALVITVVAITGL